MPNDFEKLYTDYYKKSAQLTSLEEFLEKVKQSSKMATQRLRVYKQGQETAALHKKIADIDRWSRNVKIIRAAAIGFGVSACLAPAAVTYLTGLGLTTFQAKVAVIGTGMVASGVAQTLVSSSGEVKGSSIGMEIFKFAFVEGFKERLQNMKPLTAELVLLPPEQEFDYIMQIERNAQLEASKASDVRDLQWYARNKLLVEYWDERCREFNDWWIERGWYLRDTILPALKAEVAKLKTELEKANTKK